MCPICIQTNLLHIPLQNTGYTYTPTHTPTPPPTPHPLKHPPTHTQELHHVLTVWLCPCPCASYWRPVNTSLGTLLRSDCLSSAGVQGTTGIHSCSPVKGDRASTLIDSCVHGQTDVLKCSQCEFTQFCAFTTGPRKNPQPSSYHDSEMKTKAGMYT